MGFSGGSIWQLLIILAITVMVFGTKRLKNIGSDLGSAIKGFKEAMSPEKKEENSENTKETSTASTSNVTPPLSNPDRAQTNAAHTPPADTKNETTSSQKPSNSV